MANNSRKLTTVSLFSGAGGLDVGFERAGFECIWANEFDRDAAEAWRLNRPDGAEAMHEGDIVSLLDTLPELHGRVDCIIGGPSSLFQKYASGRSQNRLGRICIPFLSDSQQDRSPPVRPAIRVVYAFDSNIFRMAFNFRKHRIVRAENPLGERMLDSIGGEHRALVEPLLVAIRFGYPSECPRDIALRIFRRYLDAESIHLHIYHLALYRTCFPYRSSNHFSL